MVVSKQWIAVLGSFENFTGGEIIVGFEKINEIRIKFLNLLIPSPGIRGETFSK